MFPPLMHFLSLTPSAVQLMEALLPAFLLILVHFWPQMLLLLLGPSSVAASCSQDQHSLVQPERFFRV